MPLIAKSDVLCVAMSSSMLCDLITTASANSKVSDLKEQALAPCQLLYLTFEPLEEASTDPPAPETPKEVHSDPIEGWTINQSLCPTEEAQSQTTCHDIMLSKP